MKREPRWKNNDNSGDAPMIDYEDDYGIDYKGRDIKIALEEARQIVGSILKDALGRAYVFNAPSRIACNPARKKLYRKMKEGS